MTADLVVDFSALHADGTLTALARHARPGVNLTPGAPVTIADADGMTGTATVDRVDEDMIVLVDCRLTDRDVSADRRIELLDAIETARQVALHQLNVPVAQKLAQVKEFVANDDAWTRAAAAEARARFKAGLEPIQETRP